MIAFKPHASAFKTHTKGVSESSGFYISECSYAFRIIKSEPYQCS